MKNLEGQRIPDVAFHTREDGKWKIVRTHDLFAGKRVVVFALPGAFTPTCSSSHAPRYNELLPHFRKAGVDDVVCVAVNDAFVMDAWRGDQGADGLHFLPDGNGEFAAAMGMLVDKRSIGLGSRSWRYSMFVRDGVIEKMFIEPEGDGDPLQVSDADTMLRFVAPGAEPPHDVLMITKPGCAFCAKAKKLLADKGWPFDEIAASPRRLRAVSRTPTTPQVFVDGRYIGGADDLEHFLAETR